MKVLFVVPSFNMGSNIGKILNSFQSQKDDSWSCIIIDDMSTDDTWKSLESISDSRFHCIKNKEKKFALKNIVQSARLFQDREDVIIAVVDGDDQLCNEDTVSILLDEYKRGHDVVWTAHRWDINGMNISKEMPEKIDPYSWPWCSSHLRTFKSSLLKNIDDKNFKDTEGEWFKRGYDQALMLPILKLSNSRKYVDSVCYQYNINSESMKERSWEEKDQISTINIVRARGFLK